MTKSQNQKVNTNYFQNLADEYKRTLNEGGAVDVITFATASWGLNFKLFPMQKFILKTFYGMQLDKRNKDIQVRDILNTKIIGTYTQDDFMKYLIDERKTNLKEYTPGHRRRQMVLCLGRRSSKCQNISAKIRTTEGTMSVGDLFNKYKNHQRIGIFTLKYGQVCQTYDIKMEENGIRECLKVITKSGKSEQTTFNHPYLVWCGSQSKWVQAKDLKKGDALYCVQNGYVVLEQIQKIQNTGLHETIAIEVGETHIIANEIVTHNSVMASVIANYQTYRLVKMDNPQDYFGFPLGQQIAVTTVATTDEQASTLFDMIKSRSVNCSFLKDRIENKTQSYFNLKTDDDIRRGSSPSVKLLCGGASSASLRGKNNLVVIFDEAAFFMQGVKNSGQQIYNALTPSIASFTHDGRGQGRIMLLSSPFSKSGLFYNKYRQSFQDDQNMLMYQMYTAMVNPMVDSAFLRSEYKKNKESFMCEFGAQFSDNISCWITEQELRQAIIDNSCQSKKIGQRGKVYYMGIDYGGKTDGTAICIVHKEGQQIFLDYADVFFSGSSDVWQATNGFYQNTSKQFTGYEVLPIGGIADKIKKLCDDFLIVDGWFDQFNGYGLLEALKERGLGQFRLQAMSAGLNTQMFQLSKMLIKGGYLKLFNHPVLIPQLITLQEEKNGGQISVASPRVMGFHDDISDAFCRAVWSCYNDNNKNRKSGTSIGFGNGVVLSNKSVQAYHLKKMKMHDGFFNRKNILGY